MRVLLDALLGLRDADLGSSISTARLRGLASAEAAVQRQRLGDLVAAGEDRVERGHRLLEDHRDAVAARRLHLLVGQRQQVGAAEPIAAGHDARRAAR